MRRNPEFDTDRMRKAIKIRKYSNAQVGRLLFDSNYADPRLGFQNYLHQGRMPAYRLEKVGKILDVAPEWLSGSRDFDSSFNLKDKNGKLIEIPPYDFYRKFDSAFGQSYEGYNGIKFILSYVNLPDCVDADTYSVIARQLMLKKNNVQFKKDLQAFIIQWGKEKAQQEEEEYSRLLEEEHKKYPHGRGNNGKH